MKRLAILLMTLLSYGSYAQGQTAKDYYNDLVKANGLEGFTNMYACFRDDPSDQFLTFSKTRDIARLYPWENFPTPKQAKEAKAEFEKDALVMLGYKKGVQVGEPYFLDKDGESWLLATKVDLRIRFTINWKTLRYRWAVETKSNGFWSVTGDHFGQCFDRTEPK